MKSPKAVLDNVGGKWKDISVFNGCFNTAK